MPINVKVQLSSGGWAGFSRCMCQIFFVTPEAGYMRDLFIFIMISVCGRSKVTDKRPEYLCSPYSDLSFLLVSG